MEEHKSLWLRVNPFALPSETTVRFNLLIVVCILLVIWMGISLWQMLGLPGPALGMGRPSVSDLPVFLEETKEVFREYRLQAIISISDILFEVSVPAALIFLVFLLAFLVYRMHPLVIRRRARKRLAADDEYPTLRQEIDRIVRGSDLRHHPQLEIVKSMRTTDAFVYGFHGHYRLRVDSGLARLRKIDPLKFEALLLHELGHIANDDVGKYYFSYALLIAMSTLIFGPAILAQLFRIVHALVISEPLRWAFNILSMFQAIFIFALILWIQAGLLRVREKYADWYAASHGARQVLADSFSVAQDQSPRESMVKRMFKFHPSFQERLEAVQNPSSLFRFPLMIAFIVGVLFALGLGGLVLMSFILSLILLDLNTLLIAGTAYSDTILDNIVGRLFLDPVMYIGFIAGLVGPLLLLLGTLSGILGIEGQREAVFDLLHGKPKLTRYLRVFVIALLVSLGIEIGLFLTPTPILSPIILFSDIVGPVEGSPEVGVLWTFLLSTMMIGGCLSLARFSTLRILAMHNGQKPPRLTSRLINLVLTILIWVFYLAIFIARNIWIFRYGGPIFFNVTIFIIVTVIGIGLLVASFAVIWAVDLLLRRKKSVNCPHCQKVTPNSRTMNRSCLHCGRDLAAWLFLPTEELDSG